MKICNLFLIVFLSIFLSACTNSKESVDLQKVLSNQNESAVLWMQMSGEYKALAYQAFNVARIVFDSKEKFKKGKKAVIVDLDETMIDNSPYSAWQIAMSQPYSSDTWSKWVENRNASAIPGAVDFARYVTAHNGTVFYVSNRSQDNFVATAANLNKVGFPSVSKETLLLRQAGNNSDKSNRFQKIKEDGYQVILYIGDNLNDFPQRSYHKSAAERSQFVSDNKDKFGVDYVILPNPVYGDWELSLAKDYLKLPLNERVKVRQSALNKWGGK
ncbi:5'-nucleotidase, lipoprotein e(P4) family [Salmonella enterica]|nr:5'-nucleotidase, lipoprotein e(P4) family [Salmonella enterica]EDR5597105.1 5'-nucleotidase, lipoprotein e(P4) family [Salmonella enterica subsp. diarizonae]EBK3635501.1 5'-nucleotidase, lipoprotein e(P4) family [Salmonella enterica]EGW0492143.1 5'-nucleotidase, lipoprotein e(P4) family [Salmonella enterica]EIF8219182.1 5'-nucleotidase, lipoprotein e(P4) family [Salmonella enterica]